MTLLKARLLHDKRAGRCMNIGGIILCVNTIKSFQNQDLSCF